MACKDVNKLPIGINYRLVRSLCTGFGFVPRSYNISLPQAGCNLCSELRELGEDPACVASCPQRVIEFGDIDQLRAKHAGEPLADGCPAIPNAEMANKNFIMRVKDRMMDEDFDEFLI